MNRSTYTVIIHKNGKQKAYHTEKYLLIKRLKFIGALVSAVAIMLLFCGMALAENSSIMPLQVVFFAGFGLMVLISLIYSYVSYKEPWEKWRAANKEKVIAIQSRFRLKKARELQEGGEKNEEK